MPFVALPFCFWHTFILINADLSQKACAHFTLVLLPLRLCCVEGLLGYCWQAAQPSCLGFLLLSRGFRLPGCRDSGAICCVTASTCCWPPPTEGLMSDQNVPFGIRLLSRLGFRLGTQRDTSAGFDEAPLISPPEPLRTRSAAHTAVFPLREVTFNYRNTWTA